MGVPAYLSQGMLTPRHRKCVTCLLNMMDKHGRASVGISLSRLLGMGGGYGGL